MWLIQKCGNTLGATLVSQRIFDVIKREKMNERHGRHTCPQSNCIVFCLGDY